MRRTAWFVIGGFAAWGVLATACGGDSAVTDTAVDGDAGDTEMVEDVPDGETTGDAETTEGDGDVGPSCGDGTVDSGEECDDGNAIDGDGCEADCTWTCDPAADTCPSEQHCDATSHMCVAGCREDAGCALPTPYCDVDEHACVECIGGDGCEAGFVCVDFVCVAGCDATHPCDGTLECCGGGCIDTDTSLTHCGACDTLCDVADGTPACVAGVCTVEACDSGFGDCNADVTDGCETVTDTDPANCGTCANACPARANATIGCTAGSCEFTCTAPYGDCNGLADDGCEADLDTDAANCGTCLNGCLVPSGTPGCVGGACTVGGCDVGFGDCNGDVADGCETDTATDLLNCGSCGNDCGTPANATASCTVGVCAISGCTTGYSDCDVDFGTGCEIQTGADPANCGTCGNLCSVPNATAACGGGLCTVGSCNTGFADCNATVSDGCEIATTTDVANCGTCGNACATPAHGIAGCSAGTCGIASCDIGWGDCDGNAANGCETDLNTSITHCSACGTACTVPLHAAAVCATGTCGMGACDAGYGDCNADIVDGCETRLNTIIDCGACGLACSSTFGTPSCGGTPAVCSIACYANYGDCDGNVSNGCEIDLRTDSANCNACGNACVGGRVCVGGACVFAAPPNDLRAGAISIPWTNLNTTLTTNTAGATNNTGPVTGCGCTAGNDVFYTFTIPAGGNHLVYADTIGTTWNTSLFLQNSAGVTLTSAGVTGGQVCSDDGGMSCTSGTQSMILALLAPGTYYLVLSGCSSGAATIHFQHLPVGNGPVARLTIAAGIQSVTGTTSGTGLADLTSCRGSGPENTYWFVTCPTTAAQGFTSSTVGGATWDTVLDQRSAGRTPAGVCNDDQCNGVQSTVASSLSAGAGLHALYMDGYGGAAGAYTMRYLFGGCLTGQTLCGAACRALQTDIDNCGCCGSVCPTRANSARTCTTGTCGFTCNAGWGNCDGSATNGCETNTTNNNSNCGACGNVCAAGTSCVASSCRPVNDRCAGATAINLALGSRISITGTTTSAYHDLTAGCVSNPSAPDVYYSFTLTSRELVYVDSFGSAYDTVLFFATGCTTRLAGTTTAGDRICDDNRGNLCTTGGTASQIVALLNPGTYYLVVSGAGTAAGNFTLRFDHVRAGNGTVGLVAAGAGSLGGTTAGVGTINPTCTGVFTAPENTYWWRTCPETAAGTFTAATCGGATWDTVLSLVNASGTGNLCNDDFCGGPPARQSQISGTVAAGSGLHVMYIDGFGTAAGTYTIATTRP